MLNKVTQFSVTIPFLRILIFTSWFILAEQKSTKLIFVTLISEPFKFTKHFSTRSQSGNLHSYNIEFLVLFSLKNYLISGILVFREEKETILVRVFWLKKFCFLTNTFSKKIQDKGYTRHP